MTPAEFDDETIEANKQGSKFFTIKQRKGGLGWLLSKFEYLSIAKDIWKNAEKHCIEEDLLIKSANCKIINHHYYKGSF